MHLTLVQGHLCLELNPLVSDSGYSSAAPRADPLCVALTGASTWRHSPFPSPTGTTPCLPSWLFFCVHALNAKAWGSALLPSSGDPHCLLEAETSKILISSADPITARVSVPFEIPLWGILRSPDHFPKILLLPGGVMGHA